MPVRAFLKHYRHEFAALIPDANPMAQAA